MGGIDLELVAVGVLLVALIATSIVGNILVCIAVATDNNLRKLSNLFLVSLAIADLLVAGSFDNFGFRVKEYLRYSIGRYRRYSQLLLMVSVSEPSKDAEDTFQKYLPQPCLGSEAEKLRFTRG